MEIIVEKEREQKAIIRFVGRLDLLSTTDAKRRLAQIAAEGYCKLVVDLANVTFIDSSGLTVLISGLKAVRLAGGDLRIAQPSEEARTILELMKLDHVMRVFSTIDEAMRSY